MWTSSARSKGDASRWCSAAVISSRVTTRPAARSSRSRIENSMAVNSSASPEAQTSRVAGERRGPSRS